VLKEEEDNAVVEKRVRQILEDEIAETNLEAQVQSLLSPWLRHFLTYDPRPTLMKVKCPVLAINGEKDLQVPPKENLPAIEEALAAGGNKDYTVKELPNLNHLFQTAETGALSEYAKIEETISPTALKVIADWILEQIKKHRRTISSVAVTGESYFVNGEWLIKTLQPFTSLFAIHYSLTTIYCF